MGLFLRVLTGEEVNICVEKLTVVCVCNWYCLINVFTRMQLLVTVLSTENSVTTPFDQVQAF